MDWSSVYVIVCEDEYLYEAYVDEDRANAKVERLNTLDNQLSCGPHRVERVPMIGADNG